MLYFLTLTMVKSLKLFWFIKSYFVLNPYLFYLLILHCFSYTCVVIILLCTLVYRYQFDLHGLWNSNDKNSNLGEKWICKFRPKGKKKKNSSNTLGSSAVRKRYTVPQLVWPMQGIKVTKIYDFLWVKNAQQLLEY